MGAGRGKVVDGTFTERVNLKENGGNKVDVEVLRHNLTTPHKPIITRKVVSKAAASKKKGDKNTKRRRKASKNRKDSGFSSDNSYEKSK